MKKYPYHIYFQWSGTNLILREECEKHPNLNGEQCIVLATQNGTRCDNTLHHNELIELIESKKVEVLKNTLRETVLNKKLFGVILKAQEELAKLLEDKNAKIAENTLNKELLEVNLGKNIA